MNEGYRRIYFDKQTGEKIAITAAIGNYTPETIEQEIIKYKALSERNRETFDVIELPFGAYSQDFMESNAYRVNPETKELEFSYPDPNQPEEPQPYQPPLTEQVKTLEKRVLESENALVMLMDITLIGGM